MQRGSGAVERKMLVRVLYLALLAAAGMMVAAKAHASDREALIAEAISALNRPQRHYLLDDQGLLLVGARSLLFKFGSPDQNSDPQHPPYCYHPFRSSWSKQQIIAYANARGDNWGGQCFPFVSLLLLRSHLIDARHMLRSYKTLEQRSPKAIRDARRGDIAFYSVSETDSHAAVVLDVDPQRGLYVLDSNYVHEEQIGKHLMTWSELEGKGKPYEAADLDTLLQVLRERKNERAVTYCSVDKVTVVADLGNPASEANFYLRGWGRAESIMVSPSGDTSKRFQRLRGDNSLTFTSLLPGVNYQLTAEVEDGACDDSFNILVNGTEMYSFTADHDSTAVIRPHTVFVPYYLLTRDELEVTFRNTATDSCGLAAVFNVRLEPLN